MWIFWLIVIFCVLGVSCLTGILGCFVVWARYSLFGHALSHAALLGVAFGIAWGSGILFFVCLVCCIFSSLLLFLEHKQFWDRQAVLSVLMNGCLALGVLILSLLHYQGHWDSYLFGDVLAVGIEDLLWIYGSLIIVLLGLRWIYAPLSLMIIDEQLAQAEGHPILLYKFFFMFLLTLVITGSLMTVGIFFVSAMLVIPASAAAYLSQTRKQMLYLSVCFSILAVLVGFLVSWIFNFPTGSSIICMALIIFIVTAVWHHALRQSKA